MTIVLLVAYYWILCHVACQWPLYWPFALISK